MVKKILAGLTACAVTLGCMPANVNAAGVSPKADGCSVIIGNVRVQTLSATLARVEVKGAKGFDNRKTFHIVNRDFDGVTPNVTTADGVTSVATPSYTVYVPENASSLGGVKIANAAGRVVWKYTTLPDSNQFLPAPGDTPNAWGMADNPRIVPAEWGYAPMPSGNTENVDINGWDDDNQAPDMYIFLPKKDYKTLLKDFITLTGSSEMIPLKAFGLWHSRYHDYKDYEALELIDEYRKHGFPLDNFVVDTDWRVNASTGYDINTKSWPDMQGFLNTAHNDKHVNIMFNDHPEPQNGQHALGQTDLKYRNENLNRLLDMGMDTWWFDRNWHTTVKSPFSGISKETFGMYLYQDVTMRKRPDRRPMIMGNVDGIDNGAFNRPANISAHRYSMQWTGDTGSSTDFLKQEIQNIVRSGAVSANPYLNSDAGGHNWVVSSGLHTRWSQYAALSPIFRYHCTADSNSNIPGASLDRIPWNYGKAAEDAARTYTLMRYRLLPLYYNLSHENYLTGLPMTRRLDINYPQYAEAQSNTQYLLGDNILVAPIWQEGDVSRDIFIPDGRWTDVWNGKAYEGPQTVKLTYAQAVSPIFVRSGSITPLAENVSYIGEKDWSNIALDIHPSTKLAGKNTLYEDDGVSVGYKSGKFRTTGLETSFDSASGETVIKIGKANGSFDGGDAFDKRTWKLRLHMPESWGDIVSASLDGADVLSDVAVIKKDSTAAPFAIEGGSADAETAELTFTKPLNEQSEIRVKFASPVDEKLPEYSENSADAEISELPLISDVNLTAAGSDDWARFNAENGEIKTVSKNNGADIIGEVTTDSAPVSADAKIKFSFSDGNAAQSASSSALAVDSGSINFNVNLKKTDKNIKVYIAAQNAQGTLSVTDGAKFAKSVKISSSAGAANKLASIVANSETEGTLRFKFEKTGGSGKICLYAVAVSDPEQNEVSPVELTASLEKAPDRLNLSDDKNIDWVHLGLNGDYTALNRKADAFQMLPEPETDGNVMQVTDYHTAVTFSGGAPALAANSSHNAIAIQGSVKLTVPASNVWRELKMYIGTWQDANNIEIYDQAGSEVTKISFSAGSTAQTRCLTVRFRADADTALYVKCSRAGNGNGNISLAAYSLSNVNKTQNISAALNEAPDAVNLTEYDDWKHYSHSSAASVNTKAGVKQSAITKLTPLADSLLRAVDFKTKFTHRRRSLGKGFKLAEFCPQLFRLAANLQPARRRMGNRPLRLRVARQGIF